MPGSLSAHCRSAARSLVGARQVAVDLAVVGPEDDLVARASK